MPSRTGGAPLALALLLAGALIAPAGAHDGRHAPARAPWQQSSPWPDRIVVTFAGDPARPKRNHEYAEFKTEPGTRQRLLSALRRPQFTLPEEPDVPELLQGTV